MGARGVHRVLHQLAADGARELHAVRLRAQHELQGEAHEVVFCDVAVG